MTSCQQLLWGRLANTYQSFCQALCCQKVQRAWCLCCLAFQQVDTTVRWKNRQILKTAIKNYVCLNLLTSTFSSVYSFTLPLFHTLPFFSYFWELCLTAYKPYGLHPFISSEAVSTRVQLILNHCFLVW